jgi:hypothetical protein
MQDDKTTALNTKRMEKKQAAIRLKNQFAQEFEMAGWSKIAQDLKDCDETETLASCKVCHNVWYVTTHCRLRICPCCAYSVTVERAKFIASLCKHMKHPKLLTLTMPLWTADPQDGIAVLRTWFNMLRARKVFRPVLGGAYQIELKQKQNGWHIHLHAILDAPYLPQQLIFSEWRAITRTTAPQVDIRAATTVRAQRYIVKYLVKGSDVKDPNFSIVAWYQATKGQRLFATFGTWYNKTLEDLEPNSIELIGPCPCPNCGTIGSTYLARDGPYIWGHDIWRTMRQMLIGGQPITRTRIVTIRPTNATI